MNEVSVSSDMTQEMLQRSPQESFALLLETIAEARQQIGQNFLALGQALSLIKAQRLYEQGGFDSFYAFLRDKRVDIAAQDAERFMSMTDSRSLTLGLSKMLELMKLPAPQREQLLERGVDEMNLKELRQASQELKREGKQRCERCRRWVEHTKELEGRLFGDDEGHACYTLELEERQSLVAGRLAPAQMDQVLDSLRTEQTPTDAPPLQWLPESLFQVYGQLLQEQAQNGGEVSREALEQEREMLRKLMHLCQTRLQDLQQTLKALAELEADD